MADVKQVPWDEDSEMVTLACLMLDSDSWYIISKIVTAEDFFREKNKWVFEACASLRANKQPINQITVAFALKCRLDEHNKIDYLTACGGAAYLSHCIAQCPTTVHSAYYAKIVAKLSFHRKIITICNTIAGMAYNSGNKTSEIWLKAQEMMYALIQPLEDKQPKRQEPITTSVTAIRGADKTAPPERAKVMSTKEQPKGETKKVFRGSVSIGESTDGKPTA